MKRVVLKITLAVLPRVISLTARKSASFREFMAQRNCIAQFQLKDGSIGYHYEFRNGKLRSRAGLHPRPDVALIFKDLATALAFLKAPGKQDMGQIVHAAKNFRVIIAGRDELCVWFMQLLNRILMTRYEFGLVMRDGTH